MRFAHQYLENAVNQGDYYVNGRTVCLYSLFIRYTADDVYVAQSKLVGYFLLQPFDEQIAFELPWVLTQILQSRHACLR